jgi:hypothetical protein
MSLVELPPKLLSNLPRYLHTIEDLCSLFSTCRTLYRTCANPNPKIISRLAANSGRIFFRPHPHLLIAATARQVADWAVKHDDRRFLLEEAIQGGVDKLLKLAIEVSELTMDDIRRISAYKCDVLNPLNRKIDVAAGPASTGPMTVCNDPETTLLSWVIYGELFHHTLELVYLPLPQYKPLSSIIRYKWFVYCMPDVNSFKYMGFAAHVPQFFEEYVQEDNDRFQQLSMQHATRKFFKSSMWEDALQTSPSFQAMNPVLRERYIFCIMHMGLKSLEVLVPGRPEKLEEDLHRIANGIRSLPVGADSRDEDMEDLDHMADGIGARQAYEFFDAKAERLFEWVGDPWLWTAYPTLASDLSFTLWSNWMGDEDSDPLMEAIRSPPKKKGT